MNIRQEADDLAGKGFGHDGLGDITVEAGNQQTVAVAYGIKRGDRDDGDSTQNRIGLEIPDHFAAPQFGEFDITDDEVGGFPARRGQARLAICGWQRSVAGGLEQNGVKLQAEGIVLDDENTAP